MQATVRRARTKFKPHLQILTHQTTAFHLSQSLSFATEQDGPALVQMIRTCTNQGSIHCAQHLHSYVLRSGFGSNIFVSTALINFYAKLVSLNDAQKVFDEMPQRNVVSWNTLILGYVHCGMFYEGLTLFFELHKSELRADAFSFTAALAACGQLRLLQLGMSVHSKILRYGLELSIVVGNCLIDMYGKCGLIVEAIRVFDGLVDKDVISWNSVIAASARNQRADLAYFYLHQMPNPDTISYNQVINGIAQFGDIEDGIRILESMPNPSSSSWNAIISGYVARNRAWEALDFFRCMCRNGIVMDEFTFSSILSGVASISARVWGMMLHLCTMKSGWDGSTIVRSALIDMYSKCGQVKDGEVLFRSLPRKNIVSWNAMISGFAHNGESDKVIQYFEELKEEKNLNPDDITFVNVLAACSHNRIPLEKAFEYFASMTAEYEIVPMAEHLGSMIRLMGHHGEVWRAEKMIYELGFESCGSVWRALLGACGNCGDLQVAEVAAKKVIELEGDNEFVYIVFSNINKSFGKWLDASSVREVMIKKGVVKEAGFSCIEIDSVR